MEKKRGLYLPILDEDSFPFSIFGPLANYCSVFLVSPREAGGVLPLVLNLARFSVLLSSMFSYAFGFLKSSTKYFKIIFLFSITLQLYFLLENTLLLFAPDYAMGKQITNIYMGRVYMNFVQTAHLFLASAYLAFTVIPIIRKIE